jgi:hypothetical protein
VNERIQELAEICTVDFVDGRGVSLSEIDVEKFADLIIKECIGIADEQKKYVEDMVVFNEHDAVWNRARTQQSQQIIDKIKQHFGVEE